MIDHPENRLLVAGNLARGKNHSVILGDVHQPMIIHRDPGHCRKGLSLRSARKHDDAFWIEALDILWPNHATIRNAQLIEAMRDFDVVHHAAADKPHFSPHHSREIDHLLNAMDRARKTRNEDRKSV